ncbi:MAG: hypothetical protein DHS20C14_21300 [Phycisphaeraceae bacterium]|nr:MAG: hypothetical protein DHS20C14_21300 [Phycisphaeraceae bacterium]
MSPPDTTRPSVRAFALGEYMTNCYVVRPIPDAAGGPCWIADCGSEPGELLDYVQHEGLEPEVIVLTHAHLDHIAGLFEARTRLGSVPIWIHRAEEAWLGNPLLNLSALTGRPVTGPEPDRLLDDGDELTLCGQAWRVAHTPGHSPGGISLIHEPSRQAIVGDALFAGSIGRTDFPGSSLETLITAIRERLYTLPDDTAVYPGHGPDTTIGTEKLHNEFVRA